MRPPLRGTMAGNDEQSLFRPRLMEDGWERVYVKRCGDTVYVAFSGVQAGGAPVTNSLAPVGSGGHGLFSLLVRGEGDGGEPVLIHAATLYLFLALFLSAEFQLPEIILAACITLISLMVMTSARKKIMAWHVHWTSIFCRTARRSLMEDGRERVGRDLSVMIRTDRLRLMHDRRPTGPLQGPPVQ